ncbi:MAG TPA: M24 family metallopeptidase [Candidatus Eisenbacteria bacterium]|nr:M24 family metallopeptidase [Candidatus Eisenbacteria bacterium]
MSSPAPRPAGALEPPDTPERASARVEAIQAALLEEEIGAWLLYDFHGSNPIAPAVLGFDRLPHRGKTSRRWFYLVPARGTPRRVVHRIEPRALDPFPGETTVYLEWAELGRAVAEAVGTTVASLGTAGGFAPSIAMEYSPLARLPYVSRVDAGTVELVRAAGAQVVSSANLAQRFGGVLSPEARRDHVATGRILHGIFDAAFARVRESVRAGKPLTETSLQRWILERYDAEGMTSVDAPTVAVNAHSGDPHFDTNEATDAPIREGDFLLIDAWCKAKRPGAVYADYTQCAFVGASAPARHREIFAVVRDARDAAVGAVEAALAAGRSIRGCDVDDAARAVVRARGYGDRFLHRTGHSIGEEVHANGVHLDNLETHDDRRLLDGTLVSVEPGVYLDDFGARSEVNLLLDGGKAVVTTAPVQRELPALLA